VARHDSRARAIAAHLAFATTLERTGARSFIGVLRKADASFRVMRDQLQTAVNDDGFEIDIEIADGDKMVTGRKFEQLVVAISGEMAVMRTLHPLDFIRIKRGLAELPDRDPQKASKDRLQAEVVQSNCGTSTCTGESGRGNSACDSAGAGGRNRTGTGFTPGDFESPASTNFTTPAQEGELEIMAQ